MKLPQAYVLILMITGGFLLPVAIPKVGVDYVYFFIMVIVLFSWLLIKWEAVKEIRQSSRWSEKVLALSGIAAIYAYKIYTGSPLGVLNMLLIFLGAVVFTYGLRSLRLFWVPATYGVVLLAGYQIQTYTPNFVALQYWLAGILAASVSALGISATASGHLVSLSQASGAPLVLDITGDCTGVQGILAFGMLSTMTLLDFKPKKSRIFPIFAVGFLGAFLINIVRLLVVFLTFEYLGVAAGTTMHTYFGYLIFLVWVLGFWVIALRFMGPARDTLPQQAVTMPQLTK